ncbi:uncharacterized protein PV06_03738 [Exophiala oligosperma]|uniref:Uncharacterized protein n=2 Tax=Chaetothyriales TaxID=34395 RepID=A0A0D2DS91_9EURO|nr:uncharacterized protein PV06_03738 [Exophiala oligosperma]KAJ9641716.1 hypothetical protein H2204_002778 [Knufia peltigerae]KIW45340.1 hypothetical protein PV06_03738 [Exophiala oligosperma]
MSSTSVYTGVWTDWSHGRATGLTLTLTQDHSGYLQSFLAILVTFAGAQLWKTVAFVLHDLGTGKPLQRHELTHQQQQIILRNSHTAGNTIADLVLLVWAWRKQGVRLTRPYVSIALASLILAGFSVAGVFTGEITKSASRRMLARSGTCGTWQATGDATTYATTAMYAQKKVNDTLSAANYVANCYDNTLNSSSLQCNRFSRQSLPYTLQHNVSCPFDDSFCIDGATSAISFDTGLLNSHEDLGINAPTENRVQYRRRTVCSPLVFGDKFCRVENDTLSGLGAVDEFIRCYTGPTVYTNYTFGVDTHTYFVGTSGYQLQAYYAEAGANQTTWRPIPELARTDADVTVFYLAQNNVLYANPVDDPFFSAHQARTTPFGTNRDALTEVTMYAFDSWIDAMGCIDQHQICNPSPRNASSQVCTPLTALSGVEEAMIANSTDEDSSHLSMNPYQLSTAIRIFEAVDGWAIFDVVNAGGAAALKANDVLVGLSSPGLPIDQWVTETSTWFAQTLAAVQSVIVQYATGPGTTQGEVVSPTTKYDAAGCNNQLVFSSGAYQNFSVLGIAIVVALSGLIILLSFVLRPITNLLLYRGNARRWHRHLWLMEDKLQLQRLAYQGGGDRQGWDNVHGTIPISGKHQLFDDMTAVDDRTLHSPPSVYPMDPLPSRLSYDKLRRPLNSTQSIKEGSYLLRPE